MRSADVNGRSGRESKAVLILGHGSRRDEANEVLRRVARMLETEGGFGYVQPAFLELAPPNFHEALDIMVEKGFTDIKVMPYFLYMGNHMRKDLPKAMALGAEKHPGVLLEVTPNIGFHEKLVDIVIDRIEGYEGDGSDVPVSAPAVGTKKEVARHPIELESFKIIGDELGELSCSAAETEIVKRVIHTTADFDFKEIMRFSPNAMGAGIAALQRGADIITDVKMVGVGVSKERMGVFGSTLHCGVSDAQVIAEAKRTGETRTATAMRLAANRIDGAIVAIGNAPTALRELLRLVRVEGAAPALVVGVPVGFVGAVEAKDELLASGIEFISTPGRKGGSTVAVAIINGLLIEAASALV
jgi:precorrin-8X/cobalt-precorrin-8 methylmutase